MDCRVEPITVSLTGNPNGGKAALFNRLTRARGAVANHPRLTVVPQATQTQHCGAALPPALAGRAGLSGVGQRPGLFAYPPRPRRRAHVARKSR